MTSTTAAAYYNILRSRMSFVGFRLLKMGSETIPAWQTDRKKSQILCKPFTAGWKRGPRFWLVERWR